MKKITRRSVLRLSGLAAASLALTSCRAAGAIFFCRIKRIRLSMFVTINPQ